MPLQAYALEPDATQDPFDRIVPGVSGDPPAYRLWLEDTGTGEYR
ncbi:MAG: hypothetical protein ABEK12_01365 [Candidatus Nanohaloarchaea archaeon]